MPTQGHLTTDVTIDHAVPVHEYTQNSIGAPQHPGGLYRAAWQAPLQGLRVTGKSALCKWGLPLCSVLRSTQHEPRMVWAALSWLVATSGRV